MPALRTLGLVILAVFAASIGMLGYMYIRAIQDATGARNAALEVANACGAVISSGGNQTVEIFIPGNYIIRFIDNQIVVDNYRVPEYGLERKFAEGAPELGPGSHMISITVRDNRLVITRI